MKLELETIPVWDGIASKSECYVCDLMAEAQKDALSFYLGNSVMHPQTRVKVNENGFCSKHWQLLAAANKPQGIALMTDTYLGMTRTKLEKSINSLLGSKNPRQAKKAIQAFKESMQQREKGCLVCSSMQQRLDRYLFTTCYLWGDDQSFREALQESKGFCMHHFQLLLETAPTVLSGSLLAKFVHDLTQTEVLNLDRIAKDVYWMTQKYKSENMDKPWNGCEDAHKRGVDKITGRHRVIDPV
ncbi:MAG: hypothetical protein GX626_07960 [Spirochaetales bacterium]|jgi:hypothetical protein|nr:hypothetical protein [Spirochaetales bacterium]